MSKSAGRVVAGDGSNGHLTAEHIVDLGIKHGAFRASERTAVLARAKVNPSGVLTTVCRVLAATRPATPATPATAASGAAVAAGSPVTYPRPWSRAVATAQRATSGLRVGAARQRAASAVRAQSPVHDPHSGPAFAAHTRAAAEATQQQAQGRTVDAFYDKRPQASSAAAEQTARYEADLRRMANEQRARGIG